MKSLTILAAGKPCRGTDPVALYEYDRKGHHIIDWNINVFDEYVDEINLVSGYKAEMFVEKYPRIHHYINPVWAKTGILYSLFRVPLDKRKEMCIMYGDIVISKKAAALISKKRADIVIAIDNNWKHRYQARSIQEIRKAEKVKLKDGVPVQFLKSTGDAEFAGVIKLSSKVIEHIKDMKIKKKASLLDLLNSLISQEFKVEVVDIADNWAEMNAPQDLARFFLGTKAETLLNLKNIVKKSAIADQVSFTVSQFNKNKKEITEKIQRVFLNQKTIIRSSSLKEDSFSTSNAGAFLSLLNIDTSSPQFLEEAISRVIQSYRENSPENQVLVQNMIEDVICSGVVMTRILNSGAAYYTVNYDLSNNTEAVTSGEYITKTLICSRKHVDLLAKKEETLSRLGSSLKEIENVLGYDSLDIEFAITKNNKVWILQVRPISVDFQQWKTNDRKVLDVIEEAASFYESMQPAENNIVGSKTIFGNMPDWNPAEIIGTRPRQLAFSLYRYLITNSIWAQSRAMFGYRNINPKPLIYSFCGHPYVDVRASFNSFIPAGLSDELAKKLVDFYIKNLSENPGLHDKIEFSIAITCYSFDYDERSRFLKKNGFSDKEIHDLKQALIKINNSAFKLYKEDLSKIDILRKRYAKTVKTKSLLRQAYSLLEDAREYGTKPFSNLARAAFISVTLLKSMIAESVISEQEVSAFLKSLNTVASKIQSDGNRVFDKKLSWKSYIDEYGHLRPGTYEITTPNYKENAEIYLKPMVKKRVGKSQYGKNFFKKKTVKEYLAQKIKQNKLDVTVQELETFIRKTIEGRELAKFYFTRNLNKVLECFSEYGYETGLSKEDLSYLDIHDLLGLHLGKIVFSEKKHLQNKIESGQEFMQIVKAVELPTLITSIEDFYCFDYLVSQPNFVTQKSVTGNIYCLQDTLEDNNVLNGKIVLIKQSDPGYDWLFAYDIKGLITCYGGANSHMGIRCAELGLPAAIGVGENYYKKISTVKSVQLDCIGTRIEILQQ